MGGLAVNFCGLRRMVKTHGFSPCVSCSIHIMGIWLIVVISIESLWCLGQCALISVVVFCFWVGVGFVIFGDTKSSRCM